MSTKSKTKKGAAVVVDKTSAGPSPVDLQQLKSCLLALYSHLQSESSQSHSKQLLDEDEDILLLVGLKKIPEKQHNKPIQIPIPHSLYDPSNNPGSEICLFTKDPPAQAEDEVPSRISGIPIENPIKKQLAAKPVAGITKVLAISKLRKNYHEFKDRRRLLADYSLFLTDERIMPLLPPLLGSKFYEKKKQPVPVNLAAHDFTKELTKARDSTYMFINTGASMSIRISRSSFSRAETLANIQAALPVIAAHIPKKWNGIQSIHIKSQNSIALPVYNSGASIDPLIADPEPTEEEKKQKAAASKKKTDSTKKKGQKRALSQKKETKSASQKSKKVKAVDAPKSASTKKSAAPSAAAAAASSISTPTAQSTKSTGKRTRDAPSDADAQPSKKVKSTESAPVTSTPVKPKSAASNAAVSKSAVKAAATPAAKTSASQKKAPATVASKKK